MIAPPANCWTALITSANTRTPNILNFNPPWIVSPGAPTIVWLPLPRMMFAAVWKASPVTESVTRPPPNSCKLVPVRKPGATSVPPGSMIPPAKPLSRVGSVVTPAAVNTSMFTFPTTGAGNMGSMPSLMPSVMLAPSSEKRNLPPEGAAIFANLPDSSRAAGTPYPAKRLRTKAHMPFGHVRRFSDCHIREGRLFAGPGDAVTA